MNSEGSLACHTYCNTGHPFIMVISEDPWHSHILPNVHYLFLRLISVAAGIRTPNLGAGPTVTFVEDNIDEHILKQETHRLLWSPVYQQLYTNYTFFPHIGSQTLQFYAFSKWVYNVVPLLLLSHLTTMPVKHKFNNTNRGCFVYHQFILFVYEKSKGKIRISWFCSIWTTYDDGSRLIDIGHLGGPGDLKVFGKAVHQRCTCN